MVAHVELARKLIEAGAAQRRHARLMTHDLRDVPWDIDPRVVPLTASEQELLPSHQAAYRPDHPGLRSSRARTRRSASCCAASSSGRCWRQPDGVVDGRIVGAAILNDFPGDPPAAGPWLSELFREPRASPASAASCCAARWPRPPPTGSPALGLVVTGGNSAAASTRTRASRTVREDISVTMPD